MFSPASQKGACDIKSQTSFLVVHYSLTTNMPSLYCCFIHCSLSRLCRKYGKSIRDNDCASNACTIQWVMGKNNRVLWVKPHNHNRKRQSAQSTFVEVI